MTPQEKRKLEEVYTFMQNMKDFSRIPYSVDQALRRRLSGDLGLSTSAKSASSENQAVDEAGSATYSVLAPPDGFLKITINNVDYYLPYYG